MKNKGYAKFEEGGGAIRYIMEDVQVSYCKFYGRRKHETTIFFYLFWTRIRSLTIQFLHNSLTFDKLNQAELS